MVYSNIKSKNKGNFIIRIKNKLLKILIKSFPLNYFRILGIKLYGYSVGKNVYVGEDFLIINTISENNTHLEISDRVAISPRVTVVLSSDPNWSHLTGVVKPIRGSIVLKNDCWVGTGAIILPNIIVGEGAIVAAGAVVTKNVADYTVVAGVPAVVIKKIQLDKC